MPNMESCSLRLNLKKMISTTEDLKYYCKLLHPYKLIDTTADLIWPYAEQAMLETRYEIIHILEKLYNLLCIYVIHSTCQTMTWMSFFHCLLLLGVFKRIFQKHRERRKEKQVFSGTAGLTNETVKSKETEIKVKERSRMTLDADKVEEFCRGNQKPSLEWLNLIVRTLHLNFRAWAKFKVLHEIWPKVKPKLEAGPFKTLEIYDFNIGDKPFRILSIDTINYSKETEKRQQHMILDLEVAYNGNANITITYTQKSFNISLPVTLQKFSVGRVKVRVVLKNLKSQLPFVEGIQLSFLESPVIEWEAENAAKVTDLPGLNSLIKKWINQQLIERFVAPNRFTIPVTLPKKVQKRLEKLDIIARDPKVSSIVMPDPVGVVRVTVVRAENLRPTDLTFSHYATSKNINIFKPAQFSFTELLPKKGTGDPYVIVSIGKESYKSKTVVQNLNPVWQFQSEFVIEYYHKALIKLEMYDSDYSFGGMYKDDLLGRISEKVSNVKDHERLEGWYNCQLYQGRAHLKFEWYPLVIINPYESSMRDKTVRVPGALSLFLGTLQSESEVAIRPTVFMEISNSRGKVRENKSLDAVSAKKEWVFNEGKVFRIIDINDRELVLSVKVYDNKSKENVGLRKFRVRTLVTNRLDGTYKIRNSFNLSHPCQSVRLTLESKMYFDKREIHPGSKTTTGSGSGSTAQETTDDAHT